MGGVRSADVMLDVVETVLNAELGNDKHTLSFNRIRSAEQTIELLSPRTVAWSVYLDNLFVLGSSAARVDEVLRRGVRALERVGLTCGTVEFATRTLKLLGLEYDGEACTIGIPRDRVVRLRESALYVSELPTVKCKIVEALLGHFAWAFLPVRQLYSVFQSIYDEVRACGDAESLTLSAGARRELRAAGRLVHLAVHDTNRPVVAQLYVTDAEGVNATDNGGGAVVVRGLSAELAREFAFSRRWEVRPGAEPPERFVRQVSPSRTDWRTVEQRRWRFPSHNNEGELEAILLAMKEWARGRVRGWVPLLTDSAVALGALRKGRSSRPRIGRRCAMAAALSLAYDVWPVARWTPTLLCAADAPSRWRPPTWARC